MAPSKSSSPPREPAPRRAGGDGLLARGAALLVALGAAGLLLYIERERFFGAEPAATNPALAALQACLRQETAPLDKMLSEGLLDEAQAALFRSRAEARCRAQNPQ